MDKKEILKKGNFISTKKDLKKYYKFSYKCDKCHRFYGSDKKEIGKFLCPICE